ncbi:MAG: response regulator [Lachnospiraceae bacterium]|nr:response regulator [Lachnospiraceae bacterium]
MNKTRVIVMGKKETFLVRVTLNKLTDAGYVPVFTSFDINAINREWEEAALLICYLDTAELPPSDVMNYLTDKLTDDEKQVILIGDADEIIQVKMSIPESLIYRVFQRPLDNEVFIATVSELLGKMASGEFRKNILIVDDDPSYLGIVRAWLKDTYKVSMVTSGLQALKWLGKNKADLILLDYEMPVTSGPQVLEMLRSDTETRSIPVIFLTGRSDKESVMSVLSLKPEGYLLKNIEQAELLDKLDKFFAHKKIND